LRILNSAQRPTAGTNTFGAQIAAHRLHKCLQPSDYFGLLVSDIVFLT
jgi:hypothetical protein